MSSLDSIPKGIDDAIQAGKPITTISPEEFLTMTAPPSIPAHSAQQVEQAAIRKLVQAVVVVAGRRLLQAIKPRIQVEDALVHVAGDAQRGRSSGRLACIEHRKDFSGRWVAAVRTVLDREHLAPGQSGVRSSAC